ncbi:ribonuclease H-like domain-containing protein [Mycena capillaripes]|nr:ribonuclease H-like domain-containing protein [Mycena capillaripes]
MQGKLGKQPLMPILDVKTRWSSTHQMLRRAIDHCKIIDDFVGKHRDLHPLDLTDGDWDSIILVTGWLKSFRTTTTLMSTTKHPVLSFTHTIFRGLQEDLRTSIKNLPISMPSVLQNGLLNVHHKLSDYYYKMDQSPYYTWAAFLDPRILYEGLKSEFQHNDELMEQLKTDKAALEAHFNYRQGLQGPTIPIQGILQERKFHNSRNTWQSRFQVPITTPFPSGSAVAVERIFSGGRDTISLRRASLKPDTIRTLMMVKQRLRLARKAVQEILGDA